MLGQFDQVGLGHNTLTEDALALVVRSSDGILRKARNLSFASLLEGVRAGKNRKTGNHSTGQCKDIHP